MSKNKILYFIDDYKNNILILNIKLKMYVVF